MDNIRFVLEAPHLSQTQKKRPRLITSCDNCRVKKIKCIQPAPNVKCEACTNGQLICRFEDRERYFAERSRVTNAECGLSTGPSDAPTPSSLCQWGPPPAAAAGPAVAPYARHPPPPLPMPDLPATAVYHGSPGTGSGPGAYEAGTSGGMEYGWHPNSHSQLLYSPHATSVHNPYVAPVQYHTPVYVTQQPFDIAAIQHAAHQFPVASSEYEQKPDVLNNPAAWSSDPQHASYPDQSQSHPQYDYEPQYPALGSAGYTSGF